MFLKVFKRWGSRSHMFYFTFYIFFNFKLSLAIIDENNNIRLQFDEESMERGSIRPCEASTQRQDTFNDLPENDGIKKNPRSKGKHSTGSGPETTRGSSNKVAASLRKFMMRCVNSLMRKKNNMFGLGGCFTGTSTSKVQTPEVRKNKHSDSSSHSQALTNEISEINEVVMDKKEEETVYLTAQREMAHKKRERKKTETCFF